MVDVGHDGDVAKVVAGSLHSEVGFRHEGSNLHPFFANPRRFRPPSL
jgi:hypothetical protein